MRRSETGSHVVIGGTSVAGGGGNRAGLWGAALFPFLLSDVLGTFGDREGIKQN